MSLAVLSLVNACLDVQEGVLTATARLPPRAPAIQAGWGHIALNFADLEHGGQAVVRDAGVWQGEALVAAREQGRASARRCGTGKGAT